MRQSFDQNQPGNAQSCPTQWASLFSVSRSTRYRNRFGKNGKSFPAVGWGQIIKSSFPTRINRKKSKMGPRDIYSRQVRLLMTALPHVAKESCFAWKATRQSIYLCRTSLAYRWISICRIRHSRIWITIWLLSMTHWCALMNRWMANLNSCAE